MYRPVTGNGLWIAESVSYFKAVSQNIFADSVVGSSNLMKFTAD